MWCLTCRLLAACRLSMHGIFKFIQKRAQHLFQDSPCRIFNSTGKSETFITRQSRIFSSTGMAKAFISRQRTVSGHQIEDLMLEMASHHTRIGVSWQPGGLHGRRPGAPLLQPRPSQKTSVEDLQPNDDLHQSYKKARWGSVDLAYGEIQHDSVLSISFAFELRMTVTLTFRMFQDQM